MRGFLEDNVKVELVGQKEKIEECQWQIEQQIDKAMPKETV